MYSWSVYKHINRDLSCTGLPSSLHFMESSLYLAIMVCAAVFPNTGPAPASLSPSVLLKRAGPGLQLSPSKGRTAGSRCDQSGAAWYGRRCLRSNTPNCGPSPKLGIERETQRGWLVATVHCGAVGWIQPSHTTFGFV